MKKGTVQILSFVGGVTLAAVVVGVTLSKNSKIRGEIESQINSVLKTTRLVVDAYKNVASKSKAAANLITNDPTQRMASEEEAISQQQAQTSREWDAVEAKRV